MPGSTEKPTRGAVVRAWMPWLILTVTVFVWGAPQIKTALDAVFPHAKLKHAPQAPKPTGSTATQVIEVMRSTINADLDAITDAIRRLKERL